MQDKNFYKTEELIDQLHIIKAFNRINEIVTEVEEKIRLERLFFEVSLELNKERGKSPTQLRRAEYIITSECVLFCPPMFYIAFKTFKSDFL